MPIIKIKHRLSVSDGGFMTMTRSSSSNSGPSPVQNERSRSFEIKSSNSHDYSLSETGRFILYIAAVQFFSNEYEQCLEICNVDFSSLCHSVVFEGNILRLQALCLTRIYEISASTDPV